MSFKYIFDQYNWNEINKAIYSMKAENVRKALNKTGTRGLEDFMAMVSPAAEPYLEEMASMSHEITKRRFGKIIQMYIPIYLSNVCNNICTYCGFSNINNIERKILNDNEILEEISIIKNMGYDHILLVTGEANKQVGATYFKRVLELIRPYFSHIAMEIQPMGQTDYEQFINFGLNTVYIYQETYNKQNYRKYHPKGLKANFDHRLDTPDRLGKAGVGKIGLGVLLGLEDWRTDSWYCALHLDYLERIYWKTKYAISFPRLRPATGLNKPFLKTTEKDLLQLICAYRIFNENIDLSLSTREEVTFRNNAIKLGITTMSAGSKTNPGGYTLQNDSLEQFDPGDKRNAKEISHLIKESGYEPVWKDWDEHFR